LRSRRVMRGIGKRFVYILRSKSDPTRPYRRRGVFAHGKPCFA